MKASELFEDQGTFFEFLQEISINDTWDNEAHEALMKRDTQKAGDILLDAFMQYCDDIERRDTA